MKIEEAEFTAFDFETTGLYPFNGDRICEIGALRFRLNSRKPRSFHSLIDPERRISYGAFRVNGITDSMVRGKPLIGDVLPVFLKFIEGSVLVAYNAPFDLGFLKSSMGTESAKLEGFYVVDALKLARKIFPGIGRYGLGAVAEHLKISRGREHRAIADATMTWKVFRKELQMMKTGGARSVEDIGLYRCVKSDLRDHSEDSVISIIENAIRHDRRVSIIYKSSWKNDSTRRIISPKKIMAGTGHTYVSAYCHLRGEDRTFRLDCMTEISMV